MPNIKTILVTGSNGQLGQSLKSLAKDHLDYQFSFSTRAELDLSNSHSIADYFKQNTFDLIINCAAYTAVDKAEQEVELADTINHLAVKKLAEIVKKQQSILIHISTDYVFDGTNHKPYQEGDVTNPQSVYGSSKLKGEQAILASGINAIIIRTSWVYSDVGTNFVKTMLRLGQEREQLSVIFDQIGSPTYARDLAESIVEITNLLNNKQNPFSGSGEVLLYHYSNEGVCSWYDFAKAIFEISHINCQLIPIETKDYPTAAKRPHYSILNKSKIKNEQQIKIPYWKDSLQNFLSHRIEDK